MMGHPNKGACPWYHAVTLNNNPVYRRSDCLAEQGDREGPQEQMCQTLQVPNDTAQAAHYMLHTAHSQYTWPRAR